jgi:hypothetical protein
LACWLASARGGFAAGNLRCVPEQDIDEALPGSRRQTDRLALALFALLVDRSESDRRHVLAALEVGAAGPHGVLRTRMIEALRLVEADTGSFPSYRL